MNELKNILSSGSDTSKKEGLLELKLSVKSFVSIRTNNEVNIDDLLENINDVYQVEMLMEIVSGLWEKDLREFIKFLKELL